MLQTLCLVLQYKWIEIRCQYRQKNYQCTIIKLNENAYSFSTCIGLITTQYNTKQERHFKSTEILWDIFELYENIFIKCTLKEDLYVHKLHVISNKMMIDSNTVISVLYEDCIYDQAVKQFQSITTPSLM